MLWEGIIIIGLRRMKITSILFFVFFFINPAFAEECRLKEGSHVQIAQVIDGDTVKLVSGEQVRLVGIQAPKLPLGRKNFKAWPLGETAKTALEDLVLGKKVQLKYGGREKDRHERLLAHIFVGGVWVQQEMIKRGMARVYSFSDNRACVEDLLFQEDTARAEKMGVWRLPFYQIRKADNIEKLSALHNSFQLVRGKVLSTGEAKGTTYLNFGKKWKIDFTGVVSRYNLRHFKKSKIDPKNLSGKTVLVRGWVGFHNGPKIDISHPEQLQIINE